MYAIALQQLQGRASRNASHCDPTRRHRAWRVGNVIKDGMLTRSVKNFVATEHDSPLVLVSAGVLVFNILMPTMLCNDAK